MPVRLYRGSDAPYLAAIFYAAVHGLACRHYTAEQLHAWAPAVPAPWDLHRRAAAAEFTLVHVEEGDVPLAYVIVGMDGHIDHLFRAPRASASAAVSGLYQAAERRACAKGMTRLFTEASEAARPFFAARGFEVLQRRDFELRGVSIHNYAMAKLLA